MTSSDESSVAIMNKDGCVHNSVDTIDGDDLRKSDEDASCVGGPKLHQAKKLVEGEGNEVRSKKEIKRRRRKWISEDFTFPVQPMILQIIKKPKVYTNHSYRNFSRVPDESGYGVPEEIKDMTFPEKVHHIASQEVYVKIFSWMPHGRSFRVHSPGLFEKYVSQKYLGHKRYSSFLRQLSNYGFKHITTGVDRNCYYHEYMLRGIPHLCKYMPRPKNARRLIPDPENEPNFYKISESHPLPNAIPENKKGETISGVDKFPPADKDATVNTVMFQTSYNPSATFLSSKPAVAPVPQNPLAEIPSDQLEKQMQHANFAPAQMTLTPSLPLQAKRTSVTQNPTVAVNLAFTPPNEITTGSSDPATVSQVNPTMSFSNSMPMENLLSIAQPHVQNTVFAQNVLTINQVPPGTVIFNNPMNMANLVHMTQSQAQTAIFAQTVPNPSPTTHLIPTTQYITPVTNFFPTAQNNARTVNFVTPMVQQILPEIQPPTGQVSVNANAVDVGQQGLGTALLSNLSNNVSTIMHQPIVTNDSLPQNSSSQNTPK